jgi:hypothetical protein
MAQDVLRLTRDSRVEPPRTMTSLNFSFSKSPLPLCSPFTGLRLGCVDPVERPVQRRVSFELSHSGVYGAAMSPVTVIILRVGEWTRLGCQTQKASSFRMFTAQRVLAATLALAMAVSGREAMGQTALTITGQGSTEMQANPTPWVFLAPQNLPLRNLPLESLDRSLLMGEPEISYASPAFFGLIDSDIKFKLESLMTILRDARHESWVLAAYPDPQTSRPLIGAGFNLDVRATEHVQSDLLNPHMFVEPSSAQLWQAAGLNPGRLQIVLDQFDRDLKTWKKKNFRRKIKTHQLSPELTDEEATSLLRISVVLAIHNARAYCREFDQLTASQQMGFSQLVFQMGVNLEKFTQFLNAINDLSYRNIEQLGSEPESEAEHWRAVQSTLIQSDWARRFTSRAVTVIAMFDPDYDEDPAQAEREVRVLIHPLVVHQRKKPHTKSVRG